MTEDRLADLEAKITYQEDQIEKLNKTAYLQQQRIDHLEAVCEALAGQMRALNEAGAGAINERPPHY